MAGNTTPIDWSVPYILLGKLTLAATTLNNASVNLPSGTVPSSPNNGDIWSDGTHAYIRLSGVTIQLDNAGNGSVVANGRQTAQAAADTNIVTFTVPAADHSYQINSNVLVTASTLHSFGVTCSYTDEGNTARVLTLNYSQLTGAFVTAITNGTGASAYEGVPVQIRAKASTTITLASTGTFTSVAYNVEAAIIQIT